MRRLDGFRPERDGYPFRNSWSLSEADASIIHKRFEVVLDRAVGVVSALLVSALTGVPGIGAVTAEQIVARAAPQIREKIACEILKFVMPARYGMCGGMVFSALDFFRLGWDLRNLAPNPPEAPPPGPLREYILERLIDSIVLNGARFIEWIAVLKLMPDLADTLIVAAGTVIAGPLGSLAGWIVAACVDAGGPDTIFDWTKHEWIRIKAELDNVRPCPVGLIFGDNLSPFEQHQVLAIDYQNGSPERGTLVLWDNNAPDQRISVSLDFQKDELEFDHRGHPLKGFFAEVYEPKTPPVSLKRG